MSATPSERVPVELLTRAPYVHVLTYPRTSLRSAKYRTGQLRRLGVTEAVFEGRAKIGRLGVLGIGTVGVVVKAEAGGREVALKIRRTDANRPDMKQEVKLTLLANRLGIGPEVYSSSRDFIAMKLLEYQEFGDWLKASQGPGSRQRVRAMVHQVLNQCRKLDIMGIDHGQLSNFRKHIVVAEGMPWILDFESASLSRRPRNVTTAAQYVLVGGKVSPLARRTLGVRDTGGVLRALAEYKRDMSDYSYSTLLDVLRLGDPRDA